MWGFKNGISLVWKMKENKADYESKVISGSQRHEYNSIYYIEQIFK